MFEPGPRPKRGSLVPSRSLMRLDELALLDMIRTLVAPQHLPSLSFVPSSSPTLSLPSESSDRHLVAEKMPGAAPQLWPLCAALRCTHTQAHTQITQTHTDTMKHSGFPPVPLPLTHTHLHFPADPVTVDVITALNLRGIRLPLTDLTAFTTQASRRL